MALSQIQGQERLYVGSIWALRRCDQLEEKNITHVLSLVAFNPSSLKNFRNEPWTDYGSRFKHVVIDIDDVDDADLLTELPGTVRFIHEGLTDGAVFVHCAAGKSRSVSAVVAYLLWANPERFDPNSSLAAGMRKRPARATGREAVAAALQVVRHTRPMAEPNDGFMQQLALWWEMACPDNVNDHVLYQRWAYKREVEEHVAVGQAPSRLRFVDECENQGQEREDEGQQSEGQQSEGQQSEGQGEPLSASRPGMVRCKKCRKTLATGPFIQPHEASSTSSGGPCPHLFVEPLSWMRAELEKGQLNGRLVCPNERCGAGVGRYDWKGIRCACGAWVTPGLSLQRAKVDVSNHGSNGRNTSHGVDEATRMKMMGIRLPPDAERGQHL